MGGFSGAISSGGKSSRKMSLKSVILAKFEGGLSKGNCLRAKLRKAVVLEGVSWDAIVWRVVLQRKTIQG